MTLVAHEGISLHPMDVVTTYLFDYLDIDICMKLSEGYNLSNNAYSRKEYSLWTKAIMSHVV